MIYNILNNTSNMIGTLTSKNYKDFTIRDNVGRELVSFTEANKCLPGDTVEWNGTCNLVERAKHAIIGCLELASKTKYGMTSRGYPMYLFISKEYPPMIVGCSSRDTSKNQYALVNYSSWDTNLPRGELVQLLGYVGTLEIEKKIAFMVHNPTKPLKIIYDGQQDTLERVETPPMTFNIDPVGCRDVDDVLSLQIGECIELWITIADVSSHVYPGSNLDKNAYLQQATAYNEGRAVRPMLPASLSEGACSLLSGTEKLGVSLILTFDKDVNLINKEWKLSLVKTKYSFEYDTFKKEASALGIPVDLIQKIVGGLYKITDDPHEWIEGFMLYYNIEVAKILRSEGRGVLRRHSQANLETLKKYTAWDPALAFLANSSAEYCLANESDVIHWGLEASVYCHATSPIRRYADLVNQRVLKDWLLGTQTETQCNVWWLNKRQKELKQFERDMFFLDRVHTDVSTITAIVLEKKALKYKLWIPEWKRVVSWKTSGLEEGATLLLSYYVNLSSRNWKERIVFKVCT
jgi:exoribonuclease R